MKKFILMGLFLTMFLVRTNDGRNWQFDKVTFGNQYITGYSSHYSGKIYIPYSNILFIEER